MLAGVLEFLFIELTGSSQSSHFRLFVVLLMQVWHVELSEIKHHKWNYFPSTSQALEYIDRAKKLLQAIVLNQIYHMRENK